MIEILSHTYMYVCITSYYHQRTSTSDTPLSFLSSSLLFLGGLPAPALPRGVPAVFSLPLVEVVFLAGFLAVFLAGVPVFLAGVPVFLVGVVFLAGVD